MTHWFMRDIIPYGTAPVAKPSAEKTAAVTKAFENIAKNPKPFESSALKAASAKAMSDRAFVREALLQGRIGTRHLT